MQPIQNPIHNTVILVTGCSHERGIGAAIVREALRRGAQKVYATAKDENGLNEIKKWSYQKVVPLKLDLTCPEDIKKVVEVAKDTQILVNNAAFFMNSDLEDNYDPERTRKEFEVNFFGPLNLMRAFLPHFKKQGEGIIVNLISYRVFGEPLPRAPTYSATKAALHSLNESMRQALNKQNIKVFGIYPRATDTKMADESPGPKDSPANVAYQIFDRIVNNKEHVDFRELFEEWSQKAQNTLTPKAKL